MPSYRGRSEWCNDLKARFQKLPKVSQMRRELSCCHSYLWSLMQVILITILNESCIFWGRNLIGLLSSTGSVLWNILHTSSAQRLASIRSLPKTRMFSLPIRAQGPQLPCFIWSLKFDIIFCIDFAKTVSETTFLHRASMIKRF